MREVYADGCSLVQKVAVGHLAIRDEENEQQACGYIVKGTNAVIEEMLNGIVKTSEMKDITGMDHGRFV